MSYRKPTYQKIDEDKSFAYITPNIVVVIIIAALLVLPGDNPKEEQKAPEAPSVSATL